MVATLRVVEMRNNLPTSDELRDLFQGAGWRALLEQIGSAMADQVRRNMLVQGGAGPTGDFALLSGWNAGQNSNANKKYQRRLREIQQGYGTAADLADLKRMKSKGHQSSRHAGYAERKAAGKTPGRGKFGADVRLRDTGELYASIRGVPVIEANSSRVELHAEGGLPGRPTNEELLKHHALGEGNLPVRDPTENMEQFEKAAGMKFQRYLIEALKSKRRG